MKAEPYYKGDYTKRFVSLCLTLFMLALPCLKGSVKAGGSDPETIKKDINGDRKANLQAYQNRPLSFEMNKGQFEPQVRYFARGQSYDIFINSSEVALNLFRSMENSSNKSNDQKPLPLKMKFVDARNANVVGVDLLSARKNYYIGKDPNRWVKDVPTYSAVRLEGIYKGIDAVFYDNHQQLEYDLIVAPGADPSTISIKFEGVEKITVNEDSSLALSIANNVALSLPPITFQQNNGVKSPVAASYKIHKDGTVGFEVSRYDNTKRLTIDPVIQYNRYLGSTWTEIVTDVVSDKGNAYVIGYTNSASFPLSPSTPPNQSSPQLLNTKAFAVKLDSNGQVAWTVIFGSSVKDNKALDLTLFSATLYITGSTEGDDFPVVGSNASFQGGRDAFVYALDLNGSNFFSRPVGGSGGDEGTGIAVDSIGRIYLVGTTTSENLPSDGILDFNAGIGAFGTDGFIIKLPSIFEQKDSFLYCSYMGGSGIKVAVGSQEDVAYVLGYTEKKLPYVKGKPFGLSDYFMLKIDTSTPGSNSLINFCYIGSDFAEYPMGDLKIDPDNDYYLYMCGTVGSNPDPESSLPSFKGKSAAFYAALTTSNFDFIHLGMIDGSGEDVATGLDFEKDPKLSGDDAHRIFVTGYTNSTAFPIMTAGSPLPGMDDESKYYGVFGVFFHENKPLFGIVIAGTNESSFGYSVAHEYEKGKIRFVIVGVSKTKDYVTGNSFSIPSPDDKNHGEEDGVVTELELDGNL